MVTLIKHLFPFWLLLFFACSQDRTVSPIFEEKHKCRPVIALPNDTTFAYTGDTVIIVPFANESCSCKVIGNCGYVHVYGKIDVYYFGLKSIDTTMHLCDSIRLIINRSGAYELKVCREGASAICEALTIVVPDNDSSWYLNAGNDTSLNMGSTLKLHGTAFHPSRKVTKWEWSIGGKEFGCTPSSDTLFTAPFELLIDYLAVMRISDDSGGVWMDTVKLHIGKWEMVTESTSIFPEHGGFWFSDVQLHDSTFFVSLFDGKDNFPSKIIALTSHGSIPVYSVSHPSEVVSFHVDDNNVYVITHGPDEENSFVSLAVHKFSGTNWSDHVTLSDPKIRINRAKSGETARLFTINHTPYLLINRYLGPSILEVYKYDTGGWSCVMKEESVLDLYYATSNLEYVTLDNCINIIRNPLYDNDPKSVSIYSFSFAGLDSAMIVGPGKATVKITRDGVVHSLKCQQVTSSPGSSKYGVSLGTYVNNTWSWERVPQDLELCPNGKVVTDGIMLFVKNGYDIFCLQSGRWTNIGSRPFSMYYDDDFTQIEANKYGLYVLGGGSSYRPSALWRFR